MQKALGGVSRWLVFGAVHHLFQFGKCVGGAFTITFLRQHPPTQTRSKPVFQNHRLQRGAEATDMADAMALVPISFHFYPRRGNF